MDHDIDEKLLPLKRHSRIDVLSKLDEFFMSKILVVF